MPFMRELPPGCFGFYKVPDIDSDLRPCVLFLLGTSDWLVEVTVIKAELPRVSRVGPPAA
ncbi:hypothetical protein KOR34_47880 [Posidoniimonas corsicana]|uniref:Uncharacterized protein n=1 Tax=Posidoniimonas corsicana TaxID=1938618 RepID=A0A5C5UXA7_9BACT|nr:hypothetical protein KOR34_47880 [Posidoniimonas corsicana]